MGSKRSSAVSGVRSVAVAIEVYPREHDRERGIAGGVDGFAERLNDAIDQHLQYGGPGALGEFVDEGVGVSVERAVGELDRPSDGVPGAGGGVVQCRGDGEYGERYRTEVRVDGVTFGPGRAYSRERERDRVADLEEVIGRNRVEDATGGL